MFAIFKRVVEICHLNLTLQLVLIKFSRTVIHKQTARFK